MPLHLLSKKSWNVYAPDNIERVRRDEAAAAAREEEDERRMQQHDAERRIAILRGQRPPSPAPDLETSAESARRKGRERDGGHGRKRRKLAGEDDTDRDIRIAREDAELAAAAKHKLTEGRKHQSNAPLHGHDGHINLFPVDAHAARKAEKNAEAEAETQRKKREYEDQYTMRFSNAAGRGGLDQAWYARGAFQSNDMRQAKDSGVDLAESKDVWGRPDPKRKEREAMRTSSNDPLAFMKKAQGQLKEAERDRQRWKEERDREMKKLERLHQSEREERRRRNREAESEDFSLDAPLEGVGDGEDGRRSHRRRRRSRSRDRCGKSHPRQSMSKENDDRRHRHRYHKRHYDYD